MTGGAAEVKRCSPDEDRRFGEMCRWLKANGLEMHSPKRGAPYLQKKPSRSMIPTPNPGPGGAA